MADRRTVRYEKAGHVAVVTLDRPERLNAINAQLGHELLAALSECEADADVRAIILTGAGRAFCAGDDLRGMEVEGFATARGPDPVKNYVHGDNRWTLAVQAMRRLPKPVIGSIRGHAHGAGFNLAMGTDIRIASETLDLAIPFVKRGMATGVNQLDRHVGLGLVLELAFTGDSIDAERALRLGLVNEVVRDAELEDAATRFAERLAAGPTRAIGLTKRAVYQGWGRDLDEAFEYQAVAQTFAAETADQAEGRRAFLEKRAPKFTGR